MKIILNMIVKNEAHIIQRCLASVRKLIDGWLIVDTGSTDGTQGVVHQALFGIPGELIERPWVDFETNRNEALKLAKERGDYLLMMDADDYLEISDGFRLPELVADGYLISQKTNEASSRSFNYLLLIKSSLPWIWKGRLHEELLCPEASRFERLENIVHSCTRDGARSRDPKKLFKDLELLKRIHREEPDNSRIVQFLGFTHEAVGQYRQALSYFEKRLSMGGWDEELFCAQYKVADLQKKLGLEPGLFFKSYGKAHQMRPWRAEPLFGIAAYAIEQQNFSLGYLTSKEAISLPFPSTDSIAVESAVYEFGALLQFVKCSFQMRRYQECFEALKRLKTASGLSEKERLGVDEVYSVLKRTI